ncbi:tRNA-dihydrouridine synthase B [Clostridium acetobutylicum]|uniref:tRNA-dihydrouridine synthase n=1 Tax=Clostridium acetobutylicum (strain ATCC 824 / DSM 792 / JCM 1419 / IAM 19013 / LMG 5710 / NBRC 13948 / NRRL B-527 / VKM B-1787 / 2291 / W) TaxID=272562 RepID=Q97EB5_CLOAB|nr:MULTISPECIES: tRNA dihydrouridine synthase DusB [Clostridium]AAK81135.1 NifR3 family enzyme [Clostridium acetobutylicum ATCC 824]ADZ22240.1 NifR3 family enzyme [Clostridium acetobutylicum EA 2018]AEI34142.1 NifR3 family protein [Clostridium acetobutylicum DSM 1731]AWV81196.1 tRNA dihydrouridine synthase DusB [Clostridium acetobutylicum]MBC2396120.1 tRNA dihydrouridine synthase DusB [Clostridium acetobutylicum]
MKVGNLSFEGNVFLAPMAGVTDIVFRKICKGMGADLTYTEMVSAKALYYGSENTEELMKISDEEEYAAVQMFGSEPDIMAKACEKFNEDDKICIIDINMGCPAHKIVKNGEGSALMKSPKLAYEIVKAVKKASNKPVTVKFRKGFDEDNINAVEFAKVIEDAGADMITVHGRTRAQMYEGKADWDIIKAVKKSVSIPVIGNGDIVSGEDAVRMLEYTNCDGVMVARAAMGNPWIFREIKAAINSTQIIKPTPVEKLDMCIFHYKEAVKYYGEKKAVREMRKNIAWYIKSLKNCTDIKCLINSEESSDEVIGILEQYRKDFL